MARLRRRATQLGVAALRRDWKRSIDILGTAEDAPHAATFSARFTGDTDTTARSLVRNFCRQSLRVTERPDLDVPRAHIRNTDGRDFSGSTYVTGVSLEAFDVATTRGRNQDGHAATSRRITSAHRKLIAMALASVRRAMTAAGAAALAAVRADWGLAGSTTGARIRRELGRFLDGLQVMYFLQRRLYLTSGLNMPRMRAGSATRAP